MNVKALVSTCLFKLSCKLMIHRYTPKRGEPKVREEEPRFKFGSVKEVYVDRPEDMEPPPKQAEQLRLMRKANPSGYGPRGGYSPPHVRAQCNPSIIDRYETNILNDWLALTVRVSISRIFFIPLY